MSNTLFSKTDAEGRKKPRPWIYFVLVGLTGLSVGTVLNAKIQKPKAMVCGSYQDDTCRINPEAIRMAREGENGRETAFQMTSEEAALELVGQAEEPSRLYQVDVLTKDPERLLRNLRLPVEKAGTDTFRVTLNITKTQASTPTPTGQTEPVVQDE
jgi:hypothetical protein